MKLLALWPVLLIRQRIMDRRLARQLAKQEELRAKQESIVATAGFSTRIVDDKGKETGRTETHFLLFCLDGNDRRYCRIETTSPEQSREHNQLLSARIGWVHHAILPEQADRISERPAPNLVVFPGGAA